MDIWNDYRDFIQAAEKSGDLVRVKEEVDWDLEAGAITRRVCETEAPAPLFENVKDYPGWKILGCPLANIRRFAVALGLSPDASLAEVMKVYEERSDNRIKPVIVDSGPCQENVIMGDEVNLFDLPAPMIHDGDGGRYISTWHAVIVKDPDSDFVNWGMYRQMVHTKNLLGGLCLPFSDQGRIFYGKYVPQGKPMPFATAIGMEPLCEVSAMVPLAANIPEVELAGALKQKPIELVRCKTVDLLVPANTELVLEGEMLLPDAFYDEGPFGEYTGYRTSPREPRPVYKVNCITHRNDPIFTMSNMGVPVDDSAAIMQVTLALEIKKLLKSQGMPITDVYCPPFGITYAIIVGVKTQVYSNAAHHIGNLIFGHKLAGPWSQIVIAVDEDVDIFNLKEVFHAFSTKLHPGRSIHVYDRCFAAPLSPYLSFEERLRSEGAKVLFDCTWPANWQPHTEVPPKMSFRNAYPTDVQEKVLKKWEKYGFGK